MNKSLNLEVDSEEELVCGNHFLFDFVFMNKSWYINILKLRFKMSKIVSFAIIVDEKNYICMLRNKKKTIVNHDPVLVIRVSLDVLGRQRLNIYIDRI